MKNARVLTQAPRRRRFTSEQKASILLEIAQGETVSNLARLHEISESLIYNWRRESKKAPSFVRLVTSPSPSPQFSTTSSLPPARICLPSGIVIEFASSISLDDIAGLAIRLGGKP
jgi:transposase-like protein